MYKITDHKKIDLGILIYSSIRSTAKAKGKSLALPYASLIHRIVTSYNPKMHSTDTQLKIKLITARTFKIPTTTPAQDVPSTSHAAFDKVNSGQPRIVDFVQIHDNKMNEKFSHIAEHLSHIQSTLHARVDNLEDSLKKIQSAFPSSSMVDPSPSVPLPQEPPIETQHEAFVFEEDQDTTLVPDKDVHTDATEKTDLTDQAKTTLIADITIVSQDDVAGSFAKDAANVAASDMNVQFTKEEVLHDVNTQEVPTNVTAQEVPTNVVTSVPPPPTVDTTPTPPAQPQVISPTKMRTKSTTRRTLPIKRSNRHTR